MYQYPEMEIQSVLVALGVYFAHSIDSISLRTEYPIMASRLVSRWANLDM